jgi:DNA-binding transcriptional ArsR family regulator
MVKQQEGLDETFAALADPTRRAILVALGGGDRSVSELAEPFDMSLPAISKHLSVLEGAGLITREREGRVRRCHLEREPLADAMRWIADYGRFWEQSFDSLERLLAEQGKRSR